MRLLEGIDRIRRIGPIGLIVLAATIAATPVVMPTSTPDPSTFRIDGGFATVDEVVDRFITALEANDKDALLALLISPDLYRDVLMPGTVEPGQPPRNWSEKSRQYFTDNFFYKSSLYADVLLKDWGGRKLTKKQVRFTRPAKQYAWYKALGELRIDVDAVPPPEDGIEPVIRTGFLVEIGGRYKFIGFLYDDD